MNFAVKFAQKCNYHFSKAQVKIQISCVQTWATIPTDKRSETLISPTTEPIRATSEPRETVSLVITLIYVGHIIYILQPVAKCISVNKIKCSVIKRE